MRYTKHDSRRIQKPRNPKPYRIDFAVWSQPLLLDWNININLNVLLYEILWKRKGSLGEAAASFIWIWVPFSRGRGTRKSTNSNQGFASIPPYNGSTTQNHAGNESACHSRFASALSEDDKAQPEDEESIASQFVGSKPLRPHSAESPFFHWPIIPPTPNVSVIGLSSPT